MEKIIFASNTPADSAVEWICKHFVTNHNESLAKQTARNNALNKWSRRLHLLTPKMKLRDKQFSPVVRHVIARYFPAKCARFRTFVIIGWEQKQLDERQAGGALYSNCYMCFNKGPAGRAPNKRTRQLQTVIKI